MRLPRQLSPLHHTGCPLRDGIAPQLVRLCVVEATGTVRIEFGGDFNINRAGSWYLRSRPEVDHAESRAAFVHIARQDLHLRPAVDKATEHEHQPRIPDPCLCQGPKRRPLQATDGGRLHLQLPPRVL